MTLTEEIINNLLSNKILFQITTETMVKMMEDAGDVNGHLLFYRSISKALLGGEKVSEAEKEQFILLHNALIKIYNKEV